MAYRNGLNPNCPLINRARSDSSSDPPSNTDRGCAESYRFQHVRRPPDSTVDHNFEVRDGPHVALLQFGDDLDEDFDTGPSELLWEGMAISPRGMAREIGHDPRVAFRRDCSAPHPAYQL